MNATEHRTKITTRDDGFGNETRTPTCTCGWAGERRWPGYHLAAQLDAEDHTEDDQ